jgi:hypothetical protein
VLHYKVKLGCGEDLNNKNLRDSTVRLKDEEHLRLKVLTAF